MKNFFKVFGIVLASIVGVFGVAIGIIFLVNQGDKNAVRPENLSFSSPNIFTIDAFDLTIGSSTENVTVTNVILTASIEGILDFPREVTLGQRFVVWPKKDALKNNIGGNVTLTANSGTVIARCNIFVDTKIKSVNASVKDMELTNGIYSVKEGDYITFSSNVIPENALNPTKLADGTSTLADKEIIYVLYDEYGGLLSTSIAHFVNGTTSSALGNIISTKSGVGNIKIYVNKNEYGTAFYLKTYAFESYKKEQDSSTLSNTDKITNMIGYSDVFNKSEAIKFLIGEIYPTKLSAGVSTVDAFINETIMFNLKTDLGFYFETNYQSSPNTLFDVLLQDLEVSVVMDSGYLYSPLTFEFDSETLNLEITPNTYAFNAISGNLVNPKIRFSFQAEDDTTLSKDIEIDLSYRLNQTNVTYDDGTSVTKGITDYITVGDKVGYDIDSNPAATYKDVKYFIDNCKYLGESESETGLYKYEVKISSYESIVINTYSFLSANTNDYGTVEIDAGTQIYFEEPGTFRIEARYIVAINGVPYRVGSNYLFIENDFYWINYTINE